MDNAGEDGANGINGINGEEISRIMKRIYQKLNKKRIKRRLVKIKRKMLLMI